jgi:hypothetical protein
MSDIGIEIMSTADKRREDGTFEMSKVFETGINNSR